MKRKYGNYKLFFILFILLVSKNNLFLLYKNSKLGDRLTIKEEITGKVLYQNPYKFNDELVIICNDDVKKNSYVTNDNRLIGIVDKVYKNKAIIKLITNKDFIMQVKINDCYGILKNDGNIYVSSINNYCSVNVNDSVYTSNLGYSKENIYVGKIVKVVEDANEINNKYIIDTVRLSDLYYVSISKENDL